MLSPTTTITAASTTRIDPRLIRRRMPAALLAALALTTAQNPHATAQPAWDGDAADGLWTTPANWFPNAVPATGPFADVLFDGTDSGATIDLVAGTYEFGLGMILDGGSYTFTNGTFTLSGTSGLGAGTYTYQTAIQGAAFSAGELNLNQTLAAANIIIDGHNGGLVRDRGGSPTTLVKSSGFRLDLLGAHTYTGGTRLTGGNTYIDDNASLGTGNVSSTNGSARLIPVGNLTINNDILIDTATSGAFGIGAAGGGTLATTGDLVLSDNGRALLVEAGTAFTLLGDVSEPNGTQNLGLTGGGTVTFSGAKSITSEINANDITLQIDHDNAFGTAQVNFNTPGFGLKAVGTRTIANNINIGGANGSAGISIEGDVTLTGTVNPVGDFGRSRINLVNDAQLTIAGTTGNNRMRYIGDGTLTFDSTATIDTGQVWFDGVTTARFVPGLTLNNVNLRTNAATTIVPTGDFVFAPGSGDIDHTGGEATATYSGIEGGTIRVETDYGTVGGRPVVNAVDGMELTFAQNVLNLGATDRWVLTGDAASTITIEGAQGTGPLSGLNAAQTTNTWLTADVAVRFTADNALGLDPANTIFGNGREARLTPVGNRVIANNVNVGANTGDAGDGLGISGAEGTLTINGTLRSGSEDGTGQPSDGVLKLHDNAHLTLNGLVTIDDDWLIDSDGTGSTIVFNNNVSVTDSLAADPGVEVNLGSVTVTANTVGINGSLTGQGTINAVLGGQGVIEPGDSPGTITADTLDPSGGLDFAFELGTAGDDLLTLTDANPFSDGTNPLALDADNNVTVFFTDLGILAGQTFTGGFDTVDTADFLPEIENATFAYFVADGLGGFNPLSGDLGVAVTTIAGGSGRITQFTVIPEPATLALASMGMALMTRRRRA